MKQILLLILAIATFGTAGAQNPHARLNGEADGMHLRLRWELNSWPQDLKGFDIKRRKPGGNWEKLNPGVIYPEISSVKGYGNVIRDFSENQRLDSKLLTLMLAGKVKEITREKLESQPALLNDMMRWAAQDFDIALIAGFGYVDMAVPYTGIFEYGLFAVKKTQVNEAPLATFTSLGRSRPGMVIPATVNASLLEGSTIVRITVSFNPNEFAKYHASGFNFYRTDDGTSSLKLNRAPVHPSGTSSLVFDDNTAGVGSTIHYEIAPVTYFGNEGQRIACSASPGISKPGYAVARAIRNMEAALVHAKPRKSGASLVARHHSVAPTPAPATALISQISALKPVQVELAAPVEPPVENVTLAKQEKSATQVAAVYEVAKPARPTGLKAQWIRENGKTYVELAWNPRHIDDTVTLGYKVYSIIKASGNKENACAIIPMVKENTCRFEVVDTRETKYKFSIAAISTHNAQSMMSDSMETVIPSSLLPAPDVLVCTRDNNVITLNWDYPRVEGLKGFRIYQDGTIVANEYEVDQKATRFTTTALSTDKKYKFEIVAVFKSNVKSERVQACEVEVQ